MSTDAYTPVVKEGHAFREISQDFSKPAEIFREAIANALDAYALNIWLRVRVVAIRGRDKVVIHLADDGIGMNKESVKAFLNLSDSSKPTAPPRGMPVRRMTGYKGHGTKVYFNSEAVEIVTPTGGGWGSAACAGGDRPSSNATTPVTCAVAIESPEAKS